VRGIAGDHEVDADGVVALRPAGRENVLQKVDGPMGKSPRPGIDRFGFGERFDSTRNEVSPVVAVFAEATLRCWINDRPVALRQRTYSTTPKRA
jgi:hypothetical protein